MSNGDHLLALIRREFPEYHPLVSIARIAHDDSADLKLQYECHKTISKFIEPELKSVQTSGSGETERKVVISMFPGQEQPTIERGSTYHNGEDIVDVDAEVIDAKVGEDYK